MVTRKKVTGKAMSFPVGTSLGVMISIAATTVLCAVLTWLVLGNTVSESVLGYISIGILLLASALGAWVASAKIKRRPMLVCLLTGGGYLASLLAATAVFFGGQYQGVVASAAAVMAGSIMTGLLGLKGAGVGKRRHTKIKTR